MDNYSKKNYQMNFLRLKEKRADSLDLITISDQFLDEQSKHKEHGKQVENHIKTQQERLVKLMSQREELTRKSQNVIPVLEKQIKSQKIELERFTKISSLAESRLIKEKKGLEELINIEEQKINEYVNLTQRLVDKVTELKQNKEKQEYSIKNLVSEVLSISEDIQNDHGLSEKLISASEKLRK
jgi:hypothetical protein